MTRWRTRLIAEGVTPDPRMSLANERTFLAWLRTALAIGSFQRWLAAERALRRGDELPVTVLAPMLSAGLAVVAVVLILAVLVR